ncbi:MAG TPA: type II secretion system protein GspL, partial [Paraburkholderia sp.]
PAPGAPHAAARTPGIESLRWEVVAREALACRFNLCQFAFSRAGRAGLGRGGLRHWRTALGLVGAAALVSIVAVNVQWFQLRHRRDAINAEMTSLVKASFPGAPIVLDPHAQMALGLKRLAQADGELRPDDFLTLAAALARALPPVASTALAGLDYSDGAFDVTFKPGTEIDEEGLKRRLAAQGLSAQEENGKWTLKSARPGPH